MTAILSLLKHLWLGLLLIIAAACLLLFSDFGNRSKSARAVSAASQNSATSAPVSLPAHKVQHVCIVSMTESDATENLHLGIDDAYREADPGGGQYECRYYSAHGEISMLSDIMDSVRQENPDLVMTLTTPALQSAIKKLPEEKIVFSGVANLPATGAGKSTTDHLKNVTGIVAGARYAEMADFVHRILPNARRLGSLYNPAEANSAAETKRFAKELERYGIEYVLVPVNSTQDIPQATDSMLSRNIDAVCQISDNTVGQGYAGLAQCVSRSGLPFFAFEVALVRQGATGAMCRDFYDTGYVAGRIALRVLAGENTATMTIETEESQFFIMNEASVKALGLTVPQDIRERAERDCAAFNRTHPKNPL